MGRLIACFFGTGLVPFAPGTVGTVAAMAPCAAAFLARPDWNGWLPVRLAALALALACSAACVLLAPAAEARAGRRDPPEVTVDEAAGSYLAVGLAPPLDPLILFPVLFVAFRALDILKPSGIRRLQKLPSGWGVLMDDLAAGAASAAAAWCIYAAAG
ncbi:MAG: phosphatidylglycerophosphatase A [Planctomycetota bacterium]|nr:phosphatidylglycerophosphatase A [Planctomycetota bacterium]